MNKSSMANRVLVITGLILLSAISCNKNDSENLPKLSNPYLGLKPSGLEPVVFAPGTISDAGYALHGFPAFSPDNDEVYWPVILPQILFMKKLVFNLSLQQTISGDPL